MNLTVDDCKSFHTTARKFLSILINKHGKKYISLHSHEISLEKHQAQMLILSAHPTRGLTTRASS